METGERKTPYIQEFLVPTLASATSGIISRLICHPVDTCKARLQNPGSQFRSIWDVVRATVREEGPRGLYRGMGTVITIGTPAFVVYLASYEATKETLLSYSALEQYQFIGHFVAGMVAETVSCLIYVPVDVIKERLQVSVSSVVDWLEVPTLVMNGDPSCMVAVMGRQVQRLLKTGQEVSGSLPMYRGTWHALRTILRDEGIRGVYRGYGATLLSFGPYSAFYFLFYEKFKSVCQQYTGTTSKNLPFHYTVASAASAGALASWITNPLDLVRLRLQVQRGSKAAATGAAAAVEGAGAAASEAYLNTWDGMRKIMRAEGVGGLFKGSLARISFHTPLTMISMSLYDECKKFYANHLP